MSRALISRAASPGTSTARTASSSARSLRQGTPPGVVLDRSRLLASNGYQDTTQEPYPAPRMVETFARPCRLWRASGTRHRDRERCWGGSPSTSETVGRFASIHRPAGDLRRLTRPLPRRLPRGRTGRSATRARRSTGFERQTGFAFARRTARRSTQRNSRRAASRCPGLSWREPRVVARLRHDDPHQPAPKGARRRPRQALGGRPRHRVGPLAPVGVADCSRRFRGEASALVLFTLDRAAHPPRPRRAAHPPTVGAFPPTTEPAVALAGTCAAWLGLHPRRVALAPPLLYTCGDGASRSSGSTESSLHTSRPLADKPHAGGPDPGAWRARQALQLAPACVAGTVTARGG